MTLISRIRNGGGLRVLALLLAGALIAFCAAATPTKGAHAADPETYNLYWATGDHSLRQADGEFTRVGHYAIKGDGSEVLHYPCAVDNAGVVWIFSFNTSVAINLQRGESCDEGPSTGKPLPFHSDRGGGAAVLNGKNSAPSKYIAIDERGQAWTDWGTSSGITPIYSGIEFHSISTFWTEYINGNMFGTASPVMLLGKPRAQTTPSATVAAVPTTGAPSSDLVLPAALLAAGMVGGGLVIRRRKDRNRA